MYRCYVRVENFRMSRRAIKKLCLTSRKKKKEQKQKKK